MGDRSSASSHASEKVSSIYCFNLFFSNWFVNRK